MRILIPSAALLLTCACQPAVEPPTARELVANAPLLADWQNRCERGEYSQLGAAEKARLCATTHEASMTVTQMQAGKKDADFFGNMSKRK